MDWNLKGIVANNRNDSSFILGKCKIMQHDWIPILDNNVRVMDPVELKEKNLTIAKIKNQDKEIVFGYLEYKYGSADSVKAYAIFSEGNDNWVFDKIIFEQSNYTLKGYNIWDYEWFPLSKNKPKIKHPHYEQTHELEIVMIFVDNYSTIRFGYTEFSNGVYGIYLPK